MSATGAGADQATDPAPAARTHSEDEHRGLGYDPKVPQDRTEVQPLLSRGEFTHDPEEGKVRVFSTAEGDMPQAQSAFAQEDAGWYRGGRTGPVFHFGAVAASGPDARDTATIVDKLRPMANDGINRSFAGVYDGSKNQLAAQDAAERLHLILQREDAIVARGPGDVVEGASTEEEAMSRAIRRAFRAIDEEVIGQIEYHRQLAKEAGRDNPQLYGLAGTVMVQIGEVMYAANAEDGIAVLCRNGRAMKLSDTGPAHMEKASDLEDAVPSEDEIQIYTPIVRRVEIDEESDKFVLLMSYSILQKIQPQQAVDVIMNALRDDETGGMAAPSSSAAQDAADALADKISSGEPHSKGAIVVGMPHWD